MAEASPRHPQETPKAAEAFSDYVALGPDRSLRNLAEQYVAQKRYRNATTAFNQLRRWSARDGWQDRITQAANAETERILHLASELDADTFLESSRKLNSRIHNLPDAEHDAIVRIRESVRKPGAKTVTSVDVHHSGVVKHAHMDMSAFTDDEIDALAAIAERQKSEVDL